MIAARSVCERAAATFSSEPIAGGGQRQHPKHELADHAPEGGQRPADQDDDEELEGEERAEPAGISHPGKVDGERSGEAGNVPDTPRA